MKYIEYRNNRCLFRDVKNRYLIEHDNGNIEIFYADNDTDAIAYFREEN